MNLREEIKAYILELGFDEVQVEWGSIKQEDLDAILEKLCELKMPIKGIHVGNFVGISLCYLASKLKEINADNLIIAIDPNIPHRGIERPDDVTTKVLKHFDVEDIVLRLTGYSLSKSFSNDRYKYTDDYDPYEHFADESAAQYQLSNLLKMGKSWVDFAIIDGNHEGDYLSEEIMASYSLLRDGGHVYIDDLTGAWPQLVKVYNFMSESSMFLASRIGSRTGLMIKQEILT